MHETCRTRAEREAVRGGERERERERVSEGEREREHAGHVQAVTTRAGDREKRGGEGGRGGREEDGERERKRESERARWGIGQGSYRGREGVEIRARSCRPYYAL